uniref:Serine/threonine-protein kinase TOR n=1 Tax=Parastrongyloides trichosuri TaxID=131310 RepID=A0A0N4Z9E5_PARTI
MYQSFLCCWSTFKPRHYKLVDSVYPKNELESRPNANIDKLVFYSCSHGEKLSRIGEYLVLKLSRDLYRQKIARVKVTTECFIRLLKSSHHHNSQSSFIDSYLKMVERLLETNDPQMEDLAIECYVVFAQIDEVQPNYSRRYDSFIPKFSCMCYANRGDRIKQQRCNGLKGLLALIWRATSADYQSDFWNNEHMEKVIPSILINIKEDSDDSISDNVRSSVNTFSSQENAEPHIIAAECLREIMGKSSYGSFQCVLEPLLTFCDDHKKWMPPTTFATHVFKVVVYSIQGTSSIIVIEQLLKHLDKFKTKNVQERIGIATVLSNIVLIAGQSIGPLLLATYNNMLKNLKMSVTFQKSGKCTDIENELVFQETFTHAIGNFASVLPDYQKVEIMTFTTNEICKNPENEDKANIDIYYHHVLATTFLKIATKYKTVYLSTLFTDNFMTTLLRLALHPNIDIRLIVQKLFHTLLDRKNNLKQLEHLTLIDDISDLNLTVEKCSKADQMFSRRFITSVSDVFYDLMFLVESDDEKVLSTHMDAILCTMCLFCVEVGCDETLIEMLHLCASYQTMALNMNNDFCDLKRYYIHMLCGKFFNFMSLVMMIPSFHQHVKEILNIRKVNCSKDSFKQGDLDIIFDRNLIIEALKSNGLDTSRFNIILGSNADKMGKDPLLRIETPHRKGSTLSSGDIKNQLINPNNVSFDISIDWSPEGSEAGTRRNTLIEDKIIENVNLNTITSLRQLMHSPNSSIEEMKKDMAKSAELLHAYRKGHIDDVSKALLKDNTSNLSTKIKNIIENSNNENEELNNLKNKPKNVFDIAIPESFIF